MFRLFRTTEENKTNDFSPEIRKKYVVKTSGDSAYCYKSLRYLSINTFGIIGMSGSALAVHFGTWIASLDLTNIL